jgi:hypothetical protein
LPGVALRLLDVDDDEDCDDDGMDISVGLGELTIVV